MQVNNILLVLFHVNYTWHIPIRTKQNNQINTRCATRHRVSDRFRDWGPKLVPVSKKTLTGGGAVCSFRFLSSSSLKISQSAITILSPSPFRAADFLQVPGERVVALNNNVKAPIVAIKRRCPGSVVPGQKLGEEITTRIYNARYLSLSLRLRRCRIIRLWNLCSCHRRRLSPSVR